MDRTQRIAIPAILQVGMNTLSRLGTYLVQNDISKFVIFWGEGIESLFGQRVYQSIEEYKSLSLLKTFEFSDNRLEDVMSVAFTLPVQTEVVIAIGGGKILDVGKYVAFLNDMPFISIPTSTAHDGFASSGCSLLVNGRRKSVRGKMPYGIVVDLGIIKTSPEKFIFSGIGDMVSKITAIYDWQYEQKQGKAVVDDFAVMIAKKSVNSIVRMPIASIKDDFFLKELVDSLTMSGIAMEIAGSSTPASGSEHLISHALDQMSERPQLHGIQVGIATYIMSKVQEHRYLRVAQFLTDTGFFDHVATLGMKAIDFAQAIDRAADVKPNRATYIHLTEYRQKAKSLLYEDELLGKILV